MEINTRRWPGSIMRYQGFSLDTYDDLWVIQDESKEDIIGVFTRLNEALRNFDDLTVLHRDK